MKLRLLKAMRMLFCIPFLLLAGRASFAQTTVFNSDFTISAGTAYTTSNGAIGTSTTWSFLRSGTDMGARINSGMLDLTNDATGSWSFLSAWALAYNASAFAAPANATLASNPGVVTWTFNMRQIRSNPSGMPSGYYGNAYVLAGTSNTTATTGSGYAVVLGQNGGTDPLRLVRYTAGLRTSTNLILSNTTGLADFGNQYISVKVTYTPATNTWQLYVRNDGTSTFQDPATGTLTSQGSVVNNGSTATALPLTGAFWNAGISSNKTAFFDNIKITVGLPAITSISPTSKVAGSAAFTLTVNGSNFINGSTVKWNGNTLATTYVSATQLSASVPASYIASAGSASVTVVTGTGTSNAQTFIIDQASVPSIAVSTNALLNFSTIAGTASAAQSFTSSGASLTGAITATAPANFELSTSAAGTYTPTLSLTAVATTIYARIKATATAGLYTGSISFSTTGGTTKQVAVTATVLAVQPTTLSVSLVFGNATSISFPVSWTSGAGTGTGHLVVVRQGSTVTTAPTDGETYTAASFGSGSEIGAGNYVVYKGSGNTVTITGLSPTTTYYVAVYEFNGSGGTENYTTTALTGSKTTLNAPVGLQVAAANTRYVIDFDNTVEGVNNDTYTGGGINTAPEQGELNSNAWAFTGFNDGAVNFGGTSPDESESYENGISEGGSAETGVYAFEVADNNYALGFQPGTGDFAPGSVTLRFQNQTGATVNSISVGYKVYVYNDEAGSNSINFSYSADNSTYTTSTVLAQTTTATADAAPGWKAYYKVITIPVTLTANSYYYVRWTGATVSGTAYDEVALDDVVIVANPTSNYASFSGTAETFTLAGNASLTGNTTIKSAINFAAGKAIIGANTLTLSGTVTNGFTGGLQGSTSSNLVINGTTANTLSFDQTTPGTTNLFNNLSIATTGTTATTLGNNIVVNGILNVDETQTLNLGINTLTGTLATITNNGIISTQNTTTAPFASGKTWGGIGTVQLNAATTAQTLVQGTYNNLTVSTTAGATATGNVTVNGILYLPQANPSATSGSLNTGANTLTMGASATNTGIGDVSGIITRTTIAANNEYTFGHPQTAILFPSVGTLPTSLTIKTVLGAAPANKTNAILRKYDFIQVGTTNASPTKAIIRAHYLDSELNNNIENKLVDWVIQLTPTVAVLEQSRTNYSTTDNFVELANVDVSFFASAFGAKELTLANSQVATATWNGSVSNVWIHAANWTPNAVPSSGTHVIIPNATTTNFDPELTSTTPAIGTLSIEAGGIVSAPATSNFIVSGTTGAWINYGAFNAAAGSTVTFNAGTTGDATIAGNTTFNNLIVAENTTLRVLTDNQMSISGTFTKTGSFIAGSVHNTVIYNGTNQTIVTPNGAQSAYDNLTISGTGAVFPVSLTINDAFIVNQPVDFTGKTISLSGAEDHPQVIGGTASPVFTNLIINKPVATANVELATNVTVNGTLTLTSGLLKIKDYNLTLGTNPVAGTFSATNMIVAEGNGLVRRPYTALGSYTFPIGETTSNTTYSPITVNITSASAFSNAYVGVNVRDAVHPNNYSSPATLTRYWNVLQTGITGAVATVTGTYTTDAGGAESSLSAAQLNGTFNAVTNPWIKFGTLAGNTLTATGAVLTPGQNSAFTGIAASNITALITGEGTICEDTEIILSAQATGGSAPYTYQWSNGLGTGATASPSTANPGTTTYTLTVRDANGITATDTADVIVSQGADSGTLTGSQAVCNGTAAPVTLTGYIGTIVRWERSINTEFTNPVFIASTSATLSSDDIGFLTGTRYIRAVVQNGSCDVKYSNWIQIEVLSTTWDGTAWSNGIPNSNKAAVFTSNYTATASFSACTVQVTNNANVVIPQGYTATVTGRVTVTSGTFTVNSNAALVQSETIQNSGNITVMRNSNPLYRLDYTLWGSPVAAQQLQAFSPNTISNRFYTYAYNWSTATAPAAYKEIYWAENTGNNFTPGKGYLIRMPDVVAENAGYAAGTSSYTFNGTFTGTPNNGTIALPVTVTDLNTGGTLNQNGHYILVANPYPSPISVAEFFTQNSSVLEAGNGIYFWRKRNNSAESSYAHLTMLGFTANSAAGGDMAGNGGSFYYGNQAQGTTSFNSGWIISPAQGFLVKLKPSLSNTATVNFTNTMRRAAPSANGQPFFKTMNTNDLEVSRLWLNLSNSENAYSQAMVGYLEEGTLGLDYGYDGKLLGDGSAKLYSKSEGSNLAIQARPAFNATDVVPMGFAVTTAGQYTVTLDHVDGVFSTSQEIYLKDNLTGTIHDIKLAPYIFTTDAGTFDTRFEVLYMPQGQLGTDIPELAENVVIYQQGMELKVVSQQSINSIEVYDMLGRAIYNQADINATDFAKTLQVAQEVVIVKVTLLNGKTVTKKLILH